MVKQVVTIADSKSGAGTFYELTDSVASSFTLEQGAFLHSTTVDSIILQGSASWTVTINGQSSGSDAGLYELSSGNSKITIGEEGSLLATGTDGFGAILLSGGGSNTVVNKGILIGVNDSGLESGDSLTLTNAGLIAGGNSRSLYLGDSIDIITNTGTLLGDIDFGNGNNKLTNSGLISHDTAYGAGNTHSNILFGKGNDTFDNKGVIDGYVDLGGGNNKGTNSKNITGADANGISVLGGDGDANDGDLFVDIFTNNKGAVIAGGVNLRHGANTLTNAGTVGKDTSNTSYWGGDNNDTVTNAGILEGFVFLFDGDDLFSNSATGVVKGYVDLGSSVGGNNTLKNAGKIEGLNSELYSVIGGLGVDKVENLKTGVINGGVELIDGLNTFTNAGTVGEDIYGYSYVSGKDVDTVKNSGLLKGAVYLGDGNDVFTNTGQVLDIINLGAGDDIFKGGNFAETVFGAEGTDNIALGGGDDVFIAFGDIGDGGSANPDVVDGGAGIDTYDGSSHPVGIGIRVNLDSVNQTSLNWVGAELTLTKGTAMDSTATYFDKLKGFENVVGSIFNDIIFGSAAANTIQGLDGVDELLGLAGNDAIDGGAGGDVIAGGLGADLLMGGADVDRFYYSTIKDSGLTKATRDEILDFVDGVDLIALAFDFDTTTLGNQSFLDVIVDGTFTGDAGKLRVYKTATGWMIEGDVTVDGKADFSIAVRDMDHSIGWTVDDFRADL